MSTSVTFKRLLNIVSMSNQERTKKEIQSIPLTDTMELTIDGQLPILMMLRRLKLKDLTKTLDSIAADHSIWFQDFQ